MFSVRSILVDIDAVAGTHPALETALRVARRCAARLKIVDVVPDVPWFARRFASGAVERDLVSHRQEHLSTLAASAAASGLQVETAMLRGRASVALNMHIVDVTSTVVRPDASETTVLQAWIAFAEELVGSRVPPEELAAYVESMRSNASEALDALAPQIHDRLGEIRLELVKGEPADSILRFAADRQVDLVVMGTVARGGLPGLLMGNTAESVLQRLRCSVLAVKPEGFRSPIQVSR